MTLLSLGVLDCRIMKLNQNSESIDLIPCNLQLFLDHFCPIEKDNRPDSHETLFGRPKTSITEIHQLKRLIWNTRTQYFTKPEWSQFLWTKACRIFSTNNDGKASCGIEECCVFLVTDMLNKILLRTTAGVRKVRWLGVAS